MWLGDIPVAVIEAGTSPTVYWIHPDQLGRPIAMTDAAGAFVNETTWVAFGGIHVMTGSIGLDLRFPGQWYQHEGGLHYNWHRSYDPTIARYTQPDPLGLVDGPSRYAYVGSDPLQRVDPSGLQQVGITWKHGDRHAVEVGDNPFAVRQMIFQCLPAAASRDFWGRVNGYEFRANGRPDGSISIGTFYRYK